MTLAELGPTFIKLAQVFASRADMGDDAFAALTAVDLGDWVGAAGRVMTTRRGELSVRLDGPHVLLARELREAVTAAWGRPLTMNVSLPIAAVMLDLDFPPQTVKAVPILARTASLLAHLAEEQERPIGFLMAARAEEAVEYERGPGDEPA